MHNDRRVSRVAVKCEDLIVSPLQVQSERGGGPEICQGGWEGGGLSEVSNKFRTDIKDQPSYVQGLIKGCLVSVTWEVTHRKCYPASCFQSLESSK